jgi:3-dehydroquinate synthase class II
MLQLVVKLFQNDTVSLYINVCTDVPNRMSIGEGRVFGSCSSGKFPVNTHRKVSRL